MKKIIKTTLYTLLFGFVGIIVYMGISSRIDHCFFAYDLTFYNHEIDSLFQPQALKHYKIKYVYKSGERGAVYFVNSDSLRKFAVFEVNNFNDINLNEIQTTDVEKIDLSQNKTYTTIFCDSFPVLQLALNPRESNYLKISFEKPIQIKNIIKNNHYYYLKGNYSFVTLGNSQNCNIISFPREKNNEILVFKRNKKLVIIAQSIIDKSILEIINVARIESID